METKAIKTSYSSTAGTAYITFDNVKVPIENTLGPIDGGVFVILRSVLLLDVNGVGVLRNCHSWTVTSITNDGSCVARRPRHSAISSKNL